MRLRAVFDVFVHDEQQQYRRHKEHDAEVSEVALQNARHFRIGHSDKHADANEHANNACHRTRFTLVNAHLQNTPSERKHPQNGEHSENAAKRNFLNRLPQIGGVERDSLQIREYTRSRGSLEQIREQRGGDTAHRHTSLRHVVYREVVVRAEIEQAAEAGLVVPHDARAHHDIRRDKARKLASARHRANAAFGNVHAPKQRKRQEAQQHKLRAAPYHERHAQRPRQVEALGAFMAATHHPEIQAPHRKRERQHNRQRIERGELQQIRHAAARHNRDLQQQEHAGRHAFEVVTGKAIEQRRKARDEKHHADEHANRRREIRSRNKIERQIEQQHRHHAEVHVVVAFVICSIPQVVLAGFFHQLVTGAAIIRVIHILQPVRRLFFQI